MQHVRGHVPALVRPPAARSPEPQPVPPTLLSPPSPSAGGSVRGRVAMASQVSLGAARSSYCRSCVLSAAASPDHRSRAGQSGVRWASRAPAGTPHRRGLSAHLGRGRGRRRCATRRSRSSACRCPRRPQPRSASCAPRRTRTCIAAAQPSERLSGGGGGGCALAGRALPQPWRPAWRPREQPRVAVAFGTHHKPTSGPRTARPRCPLPPLPALRWPPASPPLQRGRGASEQARGATCGPRGGLFSARTGARRHDVASRTPISCAGAAARPPKSPPLETSRERRRQKAQDLRKGGARYA